MFGRISISLIWNVALTIILRTTIGVLEIVVGRSVFIKHIEDTLLTFLFGKVVEDCALLGITIKERGYIVFLVLRTEIHRVYIIVTDFESIL